MSSLKKRIQADLVLRFFLQVPLFSSLPNQYVADLSRHCVMKNHDKKQVVLSQGDIGNQTFLIMKGIIDAIWSDRDGREVIFRTHGPHELLGLDEVADNLPHAATYVCSTPSILIYIPPRESRKLANAPELQKRLAKLARAHMRHCREGYRRIAMHDLETRLALYLRDLLRTSPTREYVVIEETQLRIASKVNASRTRINTTFKKWADRGEIWYSRDKIIFNESKSFWRKYNIEAD
ncbi:Crp/Fnr family transcriptional regulator [uncultured Tateyamaria sp.]|uniref:Crp/Fnr family transcriptional regulator n=1 Tax=uncultured Tateyamaria sp. TaxID=455651 RepID=UPI00261CC908|nr:Crp/Fnr family transcriptional regulator [uncultured Tateyamaria sp.]